MSNLVVCATGRLRRTTAVITGLLIATATLVGCGSGGSANSSGRLTMNVGVQSLVLQTYYPQLAKALGYFDDEKLDVNITVGESTANSVQGLLGGSIDAYLGGPEGLTATEQGADLKFVAAAANRSIWNVVASPGVTSFQNLAGKDIGVSALQSISTVTMRQALKANGVDVNRLNYIVTGGTAKRFAALQANRVAAVPLGLPINYQAADSGGFVDLGNTNDIGAPPLVAAVVTVKQSWAQSHKEELRRFLRAYQRVINALYDPAMTQRLVDLTSKGLQVEPRYMERAIKELFLEGPSVGQSMPKDAHIDAAALQTSADAFLEFGGLKQKMDPSGLIDMSYLEDAQRSLATNPPAQ
ncbi:ABC transporter substrate-binding protein [Pseudonocardia acidicola]|uniref:ABC transporter substrate-binding protein n=1 Tax=Pseudonocardia acidicola TaxID=2724939 RepID=A0ABX1SAR5_9PSEU|nr:ABC transporter substrate-binding protein [Pseudonocardia acidicola]NMH97324.1 ABC transporter substrate-binding protein [Pseudonocardia acidicola]